MAAAAAATAGPSAITSVLNVTNNKKRWMVFGLALKVLVDHIRPFEEKEIQTAYATVKSSHGIDSQGASGRLTHWPTFLKYENINGNDAMPKVHGKYNYSAFDCRVTSHVDFAKLYLENYMAKFTMFDECCDASSVLILLHKVPVFSITVQNAADNVRQSRNAWAHCSFQDWDAAKFQQSFQDMKRLVNTLGMSVDDEANLLAELKVWETTGPSLCINTSVDPALLQMVEQRVNELMTDVDKLVFDVECDKEKIKKALQDVRAEVKELEKRLTVVEGEIQILRDEHSAVEQSLTQLEDQRTSSLPQISIEIANCEGEISFFAARHDPDTRQWLLEDFNKWFLSPGDSRAYVLLGDAGVGKSVIAGSLAQRARSAGYLGAAYFCRHNDGTRNDPRNLLGTIASQLCKCNVQYSNIVGGEGGVRMMLANSKLGVLELFTKLLQEPLGRCTPCEQRILVIIDALDETEYESRDDFLDLVMHRFPRLPKWLLFFITSRPEDTVQFTLKNYHPCIKICAGSGKHLHVYQQHEQDIKRFLEKRVDFSRLPYTAGDITKKCSGLFLYAFYMVEVLRDLVRLGNITGLNKLFPGDIDDFFRENFKRVFDKVGVNLFRTLFGCVVSAPFPLPRSFIPFLLKREKSNLDVQEVIDTVSIFLVFRGSDQTYTFLHNLIPSWLTDLNKARRFYIDRAEAGKYLKKIVLEFLPSVMNVASKEHSSIETGLLDYVLRVGVRVLCRYEDTDSMNIVYNCLKSYQFIQTRIRNSRIEIYCVIGDLKLSACCQTLGDTEKEILREVCRCLERNINTLMECPHLLLSCLRMASKVVKSNMTIPDEVSTTCMEWSWLPYHTPSTTRWKTKGCIAWSPDKTLLAEVKDGRISLFKSCSLERLFGPVSHCALNGGNHLEFSPCGNFVLFGECYRAFSIEQRRVVEHLSIPKFGVLNELHPFLRTSPFELLRPTFTSHDIKKVSALWIRTGPFFRDPDRPFESQRCLSPGAIWVAETRVGDTKTRVDVFLRRHSLQVQYSKNPKRVIKDVALFGFTNDDSFFVYLSVYNSLHALSLQSDTILLSTSGGIPSVFTPERQAGYLFLADDEDKRFFLEDFPLEFLRHFLNSSVKRPMQANFFSDDTFLVLCADSSVMAFRETGDQCANSVSFVRSHDCNTLGLQQLKKCAFSPDGKLIAAHSGAKITLHGTYQTGYSRFRCTVFEPGYEFTVAQITFSADSAFLFYCILKRGDQPFAFVWDVRRKFKPKVFDPPMLNENFCCCFTMDNKIVLCIDFQIEIFDHEASPCRLLTRRTMDVIYGEADKVTCCTVSPNNDLLACCVVDRILLYSLHNSTIQPVSKLPRAHLGRIEFCRFLKGGRYIISYVTDGAVFLWDVGEKRAVSFIRTPHERENIIFLAASPKEDRVVGYTSFGRFFEINLYGQKSEMLSLQF